MDFISKGNRELWEGLNRLEFSKALSGCGVKNGFNRRFAEKCREATADSQERKEGAWTKVVAGKRGEVNRLEVFGKRMDGAWWWIERLKATEDSRPPAFAQVSRLGAWHAEVPLLS